MTVTTQTITTRVPAGSDLQAAINAAQPGDTLILDAGAIYEGPFILPVKSGSEFITIQSSRLTELPEGVRVSPSQSPLFAKLQSAENGSPIIRTQAGAHHYKFVGIEISTTTAQVGVFDLVRLGDNEAQTTLESVPHHLIIDRSYIHGHTTQEVQRGISLNSSHSDIINSYISEVHGRGYDTQAICGWNGPGQYKIVNNYLEGSGENVMFGGSRPFIPNLVIEDIEFRQNYLFKPLSWSIFSQSEFKPLNGQVVTWTTNPNPGPDEDQTEQFPPRFVDSRGNRALHWTVKNLFELKNARRVAVEGNIFENNWTDAQAGRAIVFTPRPSDSGPAALIEDVQFTNNIVKNVGSGLLALGVDDPPQPQDVRLKRVKVQNNLWLVDGPPNGSNGVCFTIIKATDELTINRNTCLHNGAIIITDYLPSTRFVYTNNITRHNEYGIFGSGIGIGNPAIAFYFPDSIVTGNAIVKEFNAPWNVDLIYPPGNQFPETLSLAVDSNFRSLISGVGADIDAINAAISGAGTPAPSPSPTPTPTPTPTPSPTPVPSPTPTPVPSPTEPAIGTIQTFPYPPQERRQKPVLDAMWEKGWRLYDPNVSGDKAKFKKEH